MDYEFETSQESLQQQEESVQHISDILVTQIILSIGILVSIFVLNIFRPDISEYFIHSFKYHSNIEFSETILNLLKNIYDRV